MEQKQGRNCPFILYPRQDIEDIRSCVLENFGRIKYELPFLNALCVEIPEERVQTMKTNRRVAMMSEDAEVSKLPIQSGPPRNSPLGCRRRSRMRGDGVAVAIIDTGVAPHYDLIRPFNRILYFKDFVNGKKLPYDDDGHGTHVAGIALGNGYSSGKFLGTAPGAALVSLKALDREGNGSASDILAAMQWIYDNHRRYNIRVVNLSLGIAASPGTQLDPLVLGANALVCAGLCVVAAAGNSGPEKRTITSPGTSPLVLTVGSCDNENSVPDFSSRGPSPAGLPKPDVLAPGVDIISLSAENPKGYLSQTGTSMSAPYVAGLAAVYCAKYPQAHPLEVKSALIEAAQPIKKADRNTQGRGRLYKGVFR
ncbi:S8 family peptidase [Anaerovorax odorimutans]|uniref:S8 family peptidase n=1 Tax=Anaerovorax odorimutans TaxID=109327 RepID=A0ABT1RQM6_9FIRM|nr:S8 family peptidase [Anaerovorax odorimutans]MCQ4637499.1 S8 family peptidase [Anaerovorax odorimutans]